MVLLIIAAILLSVMFATMSIQPKTPKLRKLVRVLSFGGVYLTVASVILFGFLFDAADKFNGPSPDFYNYLSWLSIGGAVIGPVGNIAALVVAIFCKIKKI